MKRLLLLIVLGNFQIASFAQKQGQSRIDSLVSLLNNKTLADTVKVNILCDICFSYYTIAPEKGVKYGKQALLFAEKISYRSGIAKANRFIGANYHGLSDYPRAIEFYDKAYKIEKDLGNKKGMASNLVNLALVYSNLSDFPKALDKYFQGLKIFEEIEFLKGISTCLGNIAVLYQETADYDKAIKFASKAYEIDLKRGDISGQARHLSNLALAYTFKDNLKEANKLYINSLHKYEEIEDNRGIANVLGNLGGIYLKQFNYTAALTSMLKATKLYEDLGSQKDVATNLGNIGAVYFKMALDTNLTETPSGFEKTKKENLEKAINYTQRAVSINLKLNANYNLKENYETLSNEYAAVGNFLEAFQYHKLFQQVNDSIFSYENKKMLNNIENKREIEIREKEIASQREQLKQKINLTFAMIIGIIFLAVLIVWIFYNQRKTSDKLLLNILPEQIAIRLKKGQQPIADYFNEVSIVFIDIVGFTELSAGAPPARIVIVLNDVFTRLDKLCYKHGLEKIKTIGDSYMAASGLPLINEKHAENAANFAIEAMIALHDYTTSDGTKIKFRTGIDCGPVVAGVIGESKFIYDLWGDAVNTAARMESEGIESSIHCTDNFKNKLSNNHEIKFTAREIITIKGKGRMQTWVLK